MLLDTCAKNINSYKLGVKETNAIGKLKARKQNKIKKKMLQNTQTH